MQRFGTSSVPTHVTGLHLLKGEWKQAVDSILSLREGEHPDCVVGRLAWLEDGDFKKALSLMPRRSVAERSIWEYWSRGNKTTDLLGALTNVSVEAYSPSVALESQALIADPEELANNVRSRVPILRLESCFLRTSQVIRYGTTRWRSRLREQRGRRGRTGRRCVTTFGRLGYSYTDI